MTHEALPRWMAVPLLSSVLEVWRSCHIFVAFSEYTASQVFNLVMLNLFMLIFVLSTYFLFIEWSVTPNFMFVINLVCQIFYK